MRSWRALADAMPDRVPAGHHGLLGGAVVFFGAHPKTKRRFVVQSIEGGGWGGRPFEDGESGTVSVCQGDVRNGSIEGIELKCPVLVESRALRHGLLRRAASTAAGSASICGCRNLVEGKWNFEHDPAQQVPALGLVRRHAGEPGSYLLKQPDERDFRRWPARTFRCRSAPRRSCAPAEAAAGAIRWSAIRRWWPRTWPRG